MLIVVGPRWWNYDDFLLILHAFMYSQALYNEHVLLLKTNTKERKSGFSKIPFDL